MDSKNKSDLKNRFKEIEHTADIGIIAYGKTLEELFENAACGMLYISFGNLSINENPFQKYKFTWDWTKQ